MCACKVLSNESTPSRRSVCSTLIYTIDILKYIAGRDFNPPNGGELFILGYKPTSRSHSMIALTTREAKDLQTTDEKSKDDLCVCEIRNFVR